MKSRRLIVSNENYRLLNSFLDKLLKKDFPHYLIVILIQSDISNGDMHIYMPTKYAIQIQLLMIRRI